MSERRATVAAPGGEAAWTFLTNHAHVLLCLAGDPEARMRDVAGRVGITERAVQRIVGELEAAGYLRRVRDGRRNRYELDGHRPLRHPVDRHHEVTRLLALVAEPPARPEPAAGRRVPAAARRASASGRPRATARRRASRGGSGAARRRAGAA